MNADQAVMGISEFLRAITVAVRYSPASESQVAHRQARSSTAVAAVHLYSNVVAIRS